jgi:hypothetical protein
MGLPEWWGETSAADVDAAHIKAKEYGSLDLVIIGRTMRELLGIGEGIIDDAEIGITFYQLGKLARCISAINGGRRPSDDTWHDIVVYGMMVRRIRETGQWP